MFDGGPKMSIRRGIWAVVALVAMLPAAACSGTQETSSGQAGAEPSAQDEDQPTETTSAIPLTPITDDMTTEDRLAAARSNWAAAGPSSYDLIVDRGCTGCPQSTTRNTIIDGQLMASRPEFDGDNYTLSETMEDLFDEVENFIHPETPDVGDVQFAPATGGIVTWSMTFDESVATDDRTITVSIEDATPIPPSPHGASEAGSGCPQTEFTTVEGSEFSLSVPAQLNAQDVQGVDSEVGAYGGDDFEVSWDFGWFSNPLDYWEGPFTDRIVNYSDVGGRIVVAEPVAGFFDGRHVTAAHFMRISGEPYSWNGLTVYVTYKDPSAAAVADCIVASIDWTGDR